MVCLTFSVARERETGRPQTPAASEEGLMGKKFLVLLAGFSFGVLVTSLPVIAHHAFSAEFDSTKPVQLRGTITKMEWINPHAWMHIDVTNDDGTVDSWMIEAGPLEPSCDADGERIQWLRAPKSWSRATAQSITRSGLTGVMLRSPMAHDCSPDPPAQVPR